MPRAAKSFAVAAALAPSPRNLFVGTSGWAYPTWRPGFYPADVSPKSFLAFYASVLTSVEVNYTFRQLPTPAQLEGWLAATPPGFRFSFKAPQRITHFARLEECDDELGAFLASIAPAQAIGKLGVLLFQLPPSFKATSVNADRLARFLGSPALRSPGAPPISFEFRHESWFTEATFTQLRSANAALCVAENDELRTPDVQTAAHRCYRLRCAGGYTARELNAFAQQFTAQAGDGEVFVYLKHEDEPTGALNARLLLGRSAKASGVPVLRTRARRMTAQAFVEQP